LSGVQGASLVNKVQRLVVGKKKNFIKKLNSETATNYK
jgi:hypothetical protein